MLIRYRLITSQLRFENQIFLIYKQLNQNTHWLDASTVYGSKDATLATLRLYTGGLLKTTNDTINKRELLPISSPCTTGACFYAGN